MLWVTDAKYVGGHRLWLSFNNGTIGEVDLQQRLHGEVFEPLQDLQRFSQVRFEPDMDTVVWPNGANLAPEYLHEQMVHQGGCTRCGTPPSASDDSELPILHITEVKYLGDHRVWLQFSDGTCGEADLSNDLWGPMFEPLQDKALFAQVKLDPDMDTITWPNGADLAPEHLKALVIQQSMPVAKAS